MVSLKIKILLCVFSLATSVCAGALTDDEISELKKIAQNNKSIIQNSYTLNNSYSDNNNDDIDDDFDKNMYKNEVGMARLHFFLINLLFSFICK